MKKFLVGSVLFFSERVQRGFSCLPNCSSLAVEEKSRFRFSNIRSSFLFSTHRITSAQDSLAILSFALQFLFGRNFSREISYPSKPTIVWIKFSYRQLENCFSWFPLRFSGFSPLNQDNFLLVFTFKVCVCSNQDIHFSSVPFYFRRFTTLYGRKVWENLRKSLRGAIKDYVTIYGKS